MALAAAVLGAILGSFIATLSLRWPGNQSVVKGRSACDSCGTTLRPADLIPLISAALRRGRCRYCGAVIDPFHYRVELASAAIGGISLALSPGLAGAALALFGWLLLPLVLLDWRHFWLPNRLTLLLAATGLIAGGLLGTPLSGRLIGGAVAFIALEAIRLAYRRLRGRDGLGAGDPKLFGAIGLWLGWTLLPQVILLAAMLGLLSVLGRRQKVTKASALPFGAFLAVAAWLLAAVRTLSGAV